MYCMHVAPARRNFILLLHAVQPTMINTFGHSRLAFWMFCCRDVTLIVDIPQGLQPSPSTDSLRTLDLWTMMIPVNKE